MTSRSIIAAVTPLLLLAHPALAQRTLTCAPLVGQGQDKEAPYLHSAPHGASRPSKHRLAVKWAKGVRTFVDRAPYMEQEEDGSRHLYCGFDRDLGLHLIYKIDEVSGGLLLDDATGNLLPGGEIVSFSPNGQRYFASVQPGGVDGQEWRLYTRSGSQLWKGLSGLSAKDPKLGYDYFVATLEAPRWSSDNELQATAKCAGGGTPDVTVTLRPSRGKYSWRPAVACPAAR